MNVSIDKDFADNIAKQRREEEAVRGGRVLGGCTGEWGGYGTAV